MPLPPPMRTHYQKSLFDFEGVTEHSARNWVGDFFEQATAVLTRGVRYKDSSRYEICPDVGWSPKVLFETKAVGQSNASIIYQGRLKKDRRLVDANDVDLCYWFWRHSYRVTEAETKEQLRRDLAQALRHVLLVDLHDIEQYCWSREVKVLNTGYTKAGHPLKYGSTEKGYGMGWAVSMKQMQALCRHRIVVPKIVVYGIEICDVEVFASREAHTRFPMAQDDPKTCYLYDFERAVDRLVCVYNFCAPEPFCMYGEHGLVTQLFVARRGLLDGLWTNAHMYYTSGLSPEAGAERWFRECCLPVIRRNRPVPTQYKVKESFNIFPDGGDDTCVVGIGISTYKQNNGRAVFLIFSNGEGMPISVNLPEHMDRLGEDEFYIKDWSEKQHVADRLIKAGLVTLVDKPRVPSGHVEVATARLNRALLGEFSQEELARLRP
jgi:hypothetical protein